MTNAMQVFSTAPTTDTIYQIRVRGHIGERWAERFAGMRIRSERNGDTLLIGPVADQSALYGLLRQVRDLGLPLLSVAWLPAELYSNVKAETMKAAVYYEYGGPEVVRLAEAPRPEVGEKDVLIRVRATAVNSGDYRIRSMDVPPGFRLFARLVFGFKRPKQPILGSVVAGEVVEAGEKVTRFQVGDRIMATSGASLGAHAEYKVLPEEGAIAPLPENLSYEEAAALPFGGHTALTFLKDLGKIQAGEKILINGASGAVGTAAVQLARHFGAEVTAVCSGRNAELVSDLGAGRVIDYTREDPSQDDQTYDLIMDTVGNLPYTKVKHLLRPGGRLLAVVGSLSDMLRAVWVGLTSSHRIIAGNARETAENLLVLSELAEAGELRPVIDRTYSLAEITEAHRYVDTGRKRGSVVVRV